jgi:hypothetical protein
MKREGTLNYLRIGIPSRAKNADKRTNNTGKHTNNTGKQHEQLQDFVLFFFVCSFIYRVFVRLVLKKKQNRF